ncbi:ABC transporter permease subunit [Erwiniaceae bacterium L1_54_6]|jgi:NitT/TauT family transport system permease protein|uniref:Lipid kinase n=1 Tax=Pantoea cypripedii TaxID=55209 RepID=A0A1X1EPD8_PANCY|nr:MULTISPECIES: ABC transporter permease subunit [Pantoea]MDF7661057.1 ABC transporter permease subunit [Erwiniaceae bacterium L1_54_6]MBP2195895.1 NitT/TauT family transport system permease protein [Pantoea cypripedii]MDE1188674.1 ABC transporter permease subunit [Pantoea sp.]ORM91869.1 lipid kinase [Pantoea cypripedii]QGY27472.1 lipid kinase [Pantoea cypripedii]
MRKLINYQPLPMGRLLLGVLPLLALLLVYLFASDARLSLNAADKLLPGFNAMGDAINRMAFQPSPRTGEYLLWTDTAASLMRLLSGVLISAMLALAIGLFTGALPVVRAVLAPLVTLFALVPPLAILPILFICFGLGEVSKVVLIVIGITPLIARDLQLQVEKIPREQLVKAQTLGGNSAQILWRVILPQLMPRLFDAVRLSLSSAWLFLIAAEAIVATEGLGYRIFLMRRYLAMDVILPYVAWITLLAFALDLLLRLISRRCWPWYYAK